MVIKKSNKKGQEMSVSTLVLIVIGIVVLVLVILGFTFGWQNLWNKINVFQGGSVQDVISSCKIAATSDATFSYCSEFKKVTIGGSTQWINCQADQITGLDKTLTCDGKDKKANAQVYANSDCTKNVNADNTGFDATKDVVKYNGFSCADLFSVSGAKGAPALLANK